MKCHCHASGRNPIFSIFDLIGRSINQHQFMLMFFYNKQIVQILSAEYAYSERERLTQLIFIKDFL